MNNANDIPTAKESQVNQEGRILATFIGVAYLNGILNIHNIGLADYNFLPSLISVMIVCIGLIAESFFSIKKYQTKTYSFTIVSIALAYLALIILLQPLVNSIYYIDNLIFPVGFLVVCILILLTMSTISNKFYFIKIVGCFIVIGAILQLFTQLAQLLGFNYLNDTFVRRTEYGTRPIGNVGQPNQAAFIYAMGICSIIYLSSQKFFTDFKKKNEVMINCLILTSIILSLSIGIGICGSRGGIIIGVAASICFYVFNNMSVIQKIKNALFSFFIFVFGFIFGSILLKNFSTASSAVDRIIIDNNEARLYLLKSSWLMFKANPLTGVGWDNFTKGFLEHSHELKWLSYSNHSHFFISNIASELGLLGLVVLVPLFYIILKSLIMDRSSINSYSLSVLIVILLYSCSEFPLWYFSYFMIFISFISVFDIKVNYSFNKSILTNFAAPLLIFLASFYYLYQYRNYSILIDKFDLVNTQSERIQIFKHIKPVFGFSDQYEYIVYKVTPDSLDNLETKLLVGNRVLSKNPTPEIMLKQANILIFSGKKDDALFLLKSACLFRKYQYCDEVKNYLNNAINKFPKQYSDIYEEFSFWQQSVPIPKKD